MLNRFFYSMYCLVRISPSKDEAPQHITNILLSILFTFNVILILEILNKFFGFSFSYQNSAINNIFFYAFFLVFIHISINYNDKYKKIITYYDTKQNLEKIINHTFISLWVLFTIFFLIVI